MKFKTTTKAIEMALFAVSGAVSNKTAMPLYQGVLMQLDDDGVLTLTCTDLTMTMRTSIKVEGMEKGEIVVPVKLLTEIVKKLPEDEVICKTNDLKFKLKSGDAKFQITSFAATDFPTLRNTDKDAKAKLDVELFYSLLNGVLYAATADQTKGVLTGILLEMKDGKITTAATDGFRIASRTAPYAGTDGQAIIPAAHIAKLMRVLKGRKGDLSVSFGDNSATISFGSMDCDIRTLAGKFVAYQRFLDGKNRTVIKVDRTALVQAIDRASVFANLSPCNRVKLTLSEDGIAIDSQSEFGEVDAKCPILSFEGENEEVSFSSAFLTSCLTHLTADEIKLNFGSNADPLVIVGDGYGDIVLPVRGK